MKNIEASRQIINNKIKEVNEILNTLDTEIEKAFKIYNYNHDNNEITLNNLLIKWNGLINQIILIEQEIKKELEQTVSSELFKLNISSVEELKEKKDTPELSSIKKFMDEVMIAFFFLRNSSDYIKNELNFFCSIISIKGFKDFDQNSQIIRDTYSKMEEHNIYKYN